LLLFECDVPHAAQKRPLILRIEETEALRNLLLQWHLNRNLKTTEVFDVNQTAPLSYLLARCTGRRTAARLLRLHPSGNLVVEGRKKDLINRGGEKISAEEIENLILGHEKIHMAAVVAMPDAVMGERSRARSGESLSLAELTSFLQGKQIAKFKLPKRLEIMDSLPLSGMGKVSKRTCAKSFRPS
jgi:hypothetical protein